LDAPLLEAKIADGTITPRLRRDDVRRKVLGTECPPRTTINSVQKMRQERDDLKATVIDQQQHIAELEAARDNTAWEAASPEPLLIEAQQSRAAPNNYTTLITAWHACTDEERRQLLNLNSAVILTSNEGLRQLRGLYVAALRDRNTQQRIEELRGLAAAFGLAEAISELVLRKPAPAAAADAAPPAAAGEGETKH
jgi:hypothetical protein